MDEHIKENNVQNTGIKVDKDTLQNIANNLLKSQSSLELGSLMQLATTFLKNDSLMKSVLDLSKKKQNRSQHESKTSANQEKLANDISVQNTGNNVDKSSLDINSMMPLATTLLKNDSLMNSVTEMIKNKQNPSLSESKSTKKLEKVANNISLQNTGNNVDKSSLDFNSMMQLATTLLKNDSLMNSVTEMSKNKQNPSLPESIITKKRKKVKDYNSVNNSGKKVDKDSLDLNSLMHLATSLTKNESLMESVTEPSNKNLNRTLPESRVSKQENVELTSLFKKIENITKDLSGLRQEHSELASLSQKLENINKDMSELRQESSELASLSQKLENINKDMSELRQENSELASLSQKLENITKDISGLRQETAELSSLSQKLENFANDLSELKQELKGIKVQNSNLINLLLQNIKKTKKI
ncbi:hypothetical protein [Neobacillus sp. SuZ13]|uniref:hypothetical protein n=1 Tax=Neobacillus sp. SuZ13 TaxID=3047875 RepID=UPI0024BFD9E2|nr:hypothetical protein [Neobacillus sp. SuZ13]WHY69315.1 hypothetical protein QNH17_12020 [Neobacillus sp. SuZ13]